MMYSYTLRAESEAALIALLIVAQDGKERPFVFEAEDGPCVDTSRIIIPRPETEDGEPVDDGEGGTYIPQVPTDMWVCEVRLTEPDVELASRVYTPSSSS